MIERTFVTLLDTCERQATALATLDRLAELSTDTANPTAAQASVDQLSDAVADFASTLLLTPIVRWSDLHLKLGVLIAASEPHTNDAHAYPGLYLRTILADLRYGGLLPYGRK